MSGGNNQPKRPWFGAGAKVKKAVQHLPEGAPVTVLGLDVKDSRLHMLDYRQRYVTISSDKISRGVVESVFGPNIGWRCDTYPKLKTGGRQRVPVRGEYNLLAVSRDLIRVAGGHPLFDPQCIRGSGARPSPEPGDCLIQNTGDSVVFWSSKGVPSVMAQGH
jgi:hypothetical protein